MPRIGHDQNPLPKTVKRDGTDTSVVLEIHVGTAGLSQNHVRSAGVS